jgi:hypothetical protein
MRTKLKQHFEITYPLTHKVVRDLKIVTEHIGDLIVTGTAYCDPTVLKTEVDDRYSIDIDFVKWNGADIKPVLVVTDTLDDIEEFCIQKAACLFEKEEAA